MSAKNPYVCYVPVPVPVNQAKQKTPAALVFRVVDDCGCPVIGSVYKLSDICKNYVHALSDKNGFVTFKNLCPGKYVLSELSPASGYEPEDPADNAFQVLVRSATWIKIDGVVARHFCHRKERKEPDSIPLPTICCYRFNGENGAVIAGTGEPGYAVQIIFPNGCQACAKVHKDGSWKLDVPDEVDPEEVDALKILQCSLCGETSDTVTVPVSDLTECADPCGEY